MSNEKSDIRVLYTLFVLGVLIILATIVIIIDRVYSDMERRDTLLAQYLDKTRDQLNELAAVTSPVNFQVDSASSFIFCESTYDLSDWAFRERLQDELWRLYDRRGWLFLQYQRLGRYRGMIEAELATQELPRDLLYLFVWESGLDPTAVSWAGATGLPQFLKTAAREFRLAVNNMYDERKNPVESIRAACRYLKTYYAYFHDWLLTMAAYNHGPGAVRNKLKIQQAYRFIDLYLPGETYRYVFQIMAVKYVIAEGAMGDMSWLKPHPPLPSFQRTIVKVPKAISIIKLSESYTTDFNTFRLLNPHLPVRLSPGTYPINIPFKG